MNPAKPFVKWAGGKTQLLEQIRKYYPSQIEKYCEPFVGGGAVLFDILHHHDVKEVLINDINADLINVYEEIKLNCAGLIKKLYSMQDKYKSLSEEERKEFFYANRSRFNELKLSADSKTEKAALLIFLNKTCFNGLYRVNLKGEFNVPFNNAKNPLICDEENIKACSKVLQKVKMTVGDYSSCRNFIDKKTFVYFDPPYRPLSQSSAFTSYSSNGFTDQNQIELGQFINEITLKGAKVLASNSDPKNTNASDDFFEEIYSPFMINRIHANRMINSDAQKRGAVNELLITNIAI